MGKSCNGATNPVRANFHFVSWLSRWDWLKHHCFLSSFPFCDIYVFNQWIGSFIENSKWNRYLLLKPGLAKYCGGLDQQQTHRCRTGMRICQYVTYKIKKKCMYLETCFCLLLYTIFSKFNFTLLVWLLFAHIVVQHHSTR